MENKPIEIIEFDVVISNTVDKIIKADKIKIELFSKYLTYYSNYIVEQEMIYSKGDEEEPSDDFLRKLQQDKSTEKKRLKVQDAGLIPLNSLYISLETVNILNGPGETTTLLYKLLLEYPANFVMFHFKTREEQKEVYNKLINWQITQNNW